MLTTSITLHRKAKDGTDGVGITSADVVFAQSKSNTNPPADSDVWKTNVKELTLVDGYLWSGTKIVYSNTKTAITGKYCIGSTRDYTDIEELYYLSDSGDKIPTNVTFQSSFKPEKGKYLWTCIRYRFKAASGAAENSNWVYSTPTCAGYFGDDGVSVQSSDVVFGIGTKTQQPTSWITNFSDLILEQGKYVWTCTKTILTSSSTPIYTGAYCLGECYDFAQVDELYALSDSSTNPPDDAVFSSSYKVVKGKYLWSCVKVTYNNNSIQYLNKKCVSYFPADGKNGTNGTSFNLLGTAAGHMKTWVKPSPFAWNSIYLVDGANGGYPMTYKITTDGIKSAKAEVGDAYIIEGNLWVANTTEWVNVGNIQGAPGEPGEDGEDALNIDLSTDRLLFRWEKENFREQSASVTIAARHGNTAIDASEYSVKISSTQNFKSDMAIIGTTGKTYNLTFKADGIAMTEYVYNKDVVGGERKIKYPASSCAIKLSVTYNGITYTKTIFIDVSFTKTYGDLTWNTEQLSSTFGKLTNGYDGTLVQMESKISQNAKNIALKVSQTYYDENNKKVDTRFSIIEQNVSDIKVEVSATSDGLMATGINITDKTIKMTANNFTLYNNNNEEVFRADANGNGEFKGKVTAISGYIGGLEIYNNSYEFGGNTFTYKGLMYQNMEYDGYMPNHSINLNDRYIYVGYGNNRFGGVLIAGYSQSEITMVGGQKEFSVGAFLTVESHTDNSATMQHSTAGRFTASGNKDGISRALEVSAYGGMENYAVDAGSGDIRVQGGAFIGAFCGNVNKGNNSNNVTDNYTLQPTDSIIVCNNTKEITIRFPKTGIKAGQMFIVIAGTSSRINFGGEYGTATSILCQGELYCGTRGQWNFILFDGKTWHVRMVWN